jgi:hypothetical protein
LANFPSIHFGVRSNFQPLPNAALISGNITVSVGFLSGANAALSFPLLLSRHAELRRQAKAWLVRHFPSCCCCCMSTTATTATAHGFFIK